jgi:serine/threonine-protein kinase
MPLTNGATVAGFRIIRLIATGGMGEVYLAQHPRLPRHDALKVLPSDVSADPEFRERFHRESDMAAALWHPHIVGIHDRGEFEGRLWISMDYVDGVDAARLLYDNYSTGMPPDDVVEIVAAIADALDYAHDRGLCHRDVKPGNILLTEPSSGTRRILLADFGIARRIDDVSGLTQTNTAVGTVDYAPPEQLMGHNVDGRADQYALAATAYHLLTGSAPFANTNTAVVIGKHLNERPPRLGDVRPDLACFDATLSRALAKEPTGRFPRCEDFTEALETDYHQEPSPTEVKAAVAPTRRAAAASAPGAAETHAATQRAPTASPHDAGRHPAATAPGPPTSGTPSTSAATGGPPAPPAVAATQRKPRRRHPLRAALLTLVALAVAAVGAFVVMTLLHPGKQGPKPSIAPSSTITTPPAEPTAPQQETTQQETTTQQEQQTTQQQPVTTTPPQTTTQQQQQQTTTPPQTTTPSAPPTTTASPATTAPSSPATTASPGNTVTPRP